ncbi:heme ABC transporter permease CcmB [Erythrobacteraceae bacterium CFH 75059]|uniref:heme exporter protein CcmB n=1 Tax=Qipengyuania thermophila TaxID=2509361 RepID=UPI0010204693|nr:heme exporter protein CcmB [Qipengyuania thermophila]TCD06195.1 heme ABC transporter permease CcmB [Erythrobacteraceae bacterium CFH 75059]
MRLIAALLRRDVGMLLSGGKQGGSMLPLMFFLAVAALYPFAVGPDAAMLRRTGGGVVWIAALLASLLPVDRLIAPDLEDGTLDQLAIREVAEETVLAARIVAHWLSFAPLLLLATFVAAALFNLTGELLAYLLLGLLAGTPGLAALGVLTAALLSGVRSGPALGGLIFLPLAVPLVIFGAGSLVRLEPAAILLTAAVSLVLMAVAPFAGGAALRAAREDQA